MNLTREQAIEILNRMPYLVCSADAKLLPEMFTPAARKHLARHGQLKRTEKPAVVVTAFTVVDGKRSYTFDPQPFRVLRFITREEFRRAAPWAALGRYHYEIHGD